MEHASATARHTGRACSFCRLAADGAQPCRVRDRRSRLARRAATPYARSMNRSTPVRAGPATFAGTGTHHPIARVMLAAVLLTVVAGGRDAPRTDAQEGSGRVARAFVDALARDDLDAAMALLVDHPELQTPAGEVLFGAAPVRCYLASLARPIEPGHVLPWGGRKIEAEVSSNGQPLLITFDGGGGVILFIDISDPLQTGSTFGDAATCAADAQPAAGASGSAGVGPPGSCAVANTWVRCAGGRPISTPTAANRVRSSARNS